MTTFRNCTAETRIANGDVLRLTWSQKGWPPTLFAYYLRNALANLYTETQLIPIHSVSIVDGATAATVDASNKVAFRTVGNAVTAVQNLTEGNFVSFDAVELLSAEKKADSNTPDGATERAGNTQAKEAEVADNSLTKKLGDVLSKLGTGVQITVIVLVIVLALIYIPRGRK